MFVWKQVLVTSVEEFRLHCGAGLRAQEETITSPNVCVVRERERERKKKIDVRQR